MKNKVVKLNLMKLVGAGLTLCATFTALAQPTTLSGRWLNTRFNNSNTIVLENIKYADGKFTGQFTLNTLPNAGDMHCNRDRMDVSGTYTLEGDKMIGFRLMVPAKGGPCGAITRIFNYDSAASAFVSTVGEIVWRLSDSK